MRVSKRLKGVALLCVAAVLCAMLGLVGCSTAASSGAKDGVTALTFPISKEGETEDNQKIYAVTPFEVDMTLPEGWTAQGREDADRENAPLSLGGVYSIYDLYNADGTLVGAIGYSLYDDLTGVPEEAIPQAVFSGLRLGAEYRFDTEDSYKVVKETFAEDGKTVVSSVATADVFVTQMSDGVSAAAAPVKTNRGILAYCTDNQVFLAMELDSGLVTAEQQAAIAESLTF